MDEIITATRLSKSYGPDQPPAVAGVDFNVRERECFGFLGPNGAGKTTTMRMISCSAQRSDGELTVMSLDPAWQERDIKRRLGVVPQETNLDSVMSVIENLTVHAGYFGISRHEALPHAHELLQFVQLEDRAGWNVNALSGGMKRRLLIARALINSPHLLILDEPTTGLDPQARHLVWEKLRALRRSGVTLVITTHYMEEAAQLCDRLVIMHQGKILVEGSPRDLIREQVSPEVVELTAQTHAGLLELAARVASFASSHEVAGDRLVMHTDDGEALLKAINDARAEYETAMFRQATLEDVFLKLTGMGLEE